ncbi:hypothetical protein SCHPADRAFT_934860 [Schizopora paradoxa]|uniref:DUF6533 domain-containing protein n=1 Tax=Schizopora paradoxa TaxID=27342 RepID=A0A0H2SEW1_9AGAM|nr:hypothetical protein SCHPADRAFT_934860 [Schizopora paradoxa]
MSSTAEDPQIQGQISSVIVNNVFAETALNDIYRKLEVSLMKMGNDAMILGVASLTILFYDYILMFRHEIRFIWQSDSGWGVGKLLYLAIRYLGIISNTLTAIGNFHHGLSDQACATIESASYWTLVAEIGIAQVIIYMRTHILLGRSKSVKCMLVALFLTVFIGACIGYKLASMTYFPSSLKMVPACIGDGQATGISISYGLVCFSELVIVVLTVWSVRYEFRDMGKLLFMLYRDGILFFLCLFVISTFNIIGTLLWRDLSMLQGVMHSVLTSRVILHLHIATAGDEASARSISLPAFASPENGNATTMTTSLEQDAVGSPSYPSYPSSAPPLLSLGSLSVDFDIGIEFLEEGGSTSRVLFTAEA